MNVWDRLRRVRSFAVAVAEYARSDRPNAELLIVLSADALRQSVDLWRALGGQADDSGLVRVDRRRKHGEGHTVVLRGQSNTRTVVHSDGHVVVTAMNLTPEQADYFMKRYS